MGPFRVSNLEPVRNQGRGQETCYKRHAVRAATLVIQSGRANITFTQLSLDKYEYSSWFLWKTKRLQDLSHPHAKLSVHLTPSLQERWRWQKLPWKRMGLDPNTEVFSLGMCTPWIFMLRHHLLFFCSSCVMRGRVTSGLKLWQKGIKKKASHACWVPRATSLKQGGKVENLVFLLKLKELFIVVDVSLYKYI